MNTLLQYDQDLFLWLNSLHSTWLDQPMFLISETWPWIPFYVFLLILLIRQLKYKSWLAVIAIALTIVSADWTTVAMKRGFKRPRPTHAESIQGQVHTVNGYLGGSYGFASSHAANTFGLAMLLWLLFRKYWRFAGCLFLWAAIVSYSRIYLGVHYPLDILVGAMVGMGLAWLLSRLYFFILKI